jgi:hypothetical protein
LERNVRDQLAIYSAQHLTLRRKSDIVHKHLLVVSFEAFSRDNVEDFCIVRSDVSAEGSRLPSCRRNVMPSSSGVWSSEEDTTSLGFFERLGTCHRPRQRCVAAEWFVFCRQHWETVVLSCVVLCCVCLCELAHCYVAELGL